MKHTRILGFDPGSLKTGYGIIDWDGRKATYIDSGIIDLTKYSSLATRLKVLHKQVSILMQAYGPKEVALESLIYVKSPKSLFQLAQARGAIMVALANELEDQIYEYAPNLIKVAITGHGHAGKEEIKKCLSLELKKTNFKTHDESDALAIALCHGLYRGKVTAPGDAASIKKKRHDMKGIFEQYVKDKQL